MKISKHFDSSEFQCSDKKCGEYIPDLGLIICLEDVRAHFSRLYGDCYIKITSGMRCITHNIKVGGSKHSKHLEGIAADFQVFSKAQDYIQINPEEVADYLDLRYQDCYGIGRYKKFTHFDVRISKARWRG